MPAHALNIRSEYENVGSSPVREIPEVFDTYKWGTPARDALHEVQEGFTPRPNAVLWKGLVAGLVAGAAATAAMTVFQLAWGKVKGAISSNSAAHQPKNTSSGESEQQQDESSTVKVAEFISEHTVGKRIPQEDKEAASYAVHFAFGILMGGLYGISTEYLPIANLGEGLLHGIGLWVGADAIAMPALGLSGPVTSRSAAELSYELLAHAVYGIVSESVRKPVRNLM